MDKQGMVLIVVVVGLLAGCVLLPPVSPLPTPPVARVDAEEQYYRGLFDACMKFTGRLDGCREAVRKTHKADWYGQPSQDWQWPPADPMPQGEAL